MRPLDADGSFTLRPESSPLDIKRDKHCEDGAGQQVCRFTLEGRRIVDRRVEEGGESSAVARADGSGGVLSVCALCALFI
jgi:hypothetical protein